MTEIDTLMIGEIDGVQRFAIDVELELVGSAVADTYRSGAAIPLKVLEKLFVQVG